MNDAGAKLARYLEIIDESEKLIGELSELVKEELGPGAWKKWDEDYNEAMRIRAQGKPHMAAQMVKASTQRIANAIAAKREATRRAEEEAERARKRS